MFLIILNIVDLNFIKKICVIFWFYVLNLCFFMLFELGVVEINLGKIFIVW